MTRRSSASSPSRATSRRTPGCCASSAPSRARCACRPTSTGSTALVMPGGESTTMTLGIEREGLAEPLRELARVRHAGARHLRGHDHARPRAPRADGHCARERNAFGRQVRSFEADLDDPGHRRAAGARGVHPRAVDRRARRGGRGPRLGRRPSGRRAPGQPARDLLPPGDRRRDAAARAVPGAGAGPHRGAAEVGFRRPVAASGDLRRRTRRAGARARARSGGTPARTRPSPTAAASVCARRLRRPRRRCRRRSGAPRRG